MSEHWKLRFDLPCATADPELFFPSLRTEFGRQQAEVAKSYCRECPVRDLCLAEALENHEEGVWGGTDDLERNEMLGLKYRRVAVSAA